jgi:hypothetical protein
LLNPWLPGFLLRRRLRAKALDLLYLDQALDTLGQGQLTDSEIREVRFPTTPPYNPISRLPFIDLNKVNTVLPLYKWVEME